MLKGTLKRTISLSFLIVVTCTSPVSARMFDSKMKEGMKNYEQQKYDLALKEFIDAQIEAPEDARLSYNTGNAYYKMNNYDEAIKSFLNGAAKAKDIKLREKSYYNLGNSFYRQGKLQEAVQYYQQALELDPEDTDAKKNLEFVRQEIKRRMNEEKERQEKEPSQDQDQQQQGEGQEQQQSEQQQPEQQEQQAQDKGQQQEQQGQQEQGKQEGQQEQYAAQAAAQAAEQISEEEAQRWLDSLSEDKKEFLKRQMKASPGARYSAGKDW